MTIIGYKPQNNRIKPIATNDITQATTVTDVTGEALTLTGGAGSTGKIRLAYAPIMDSLGGSLGTPGDTSVSIGGTLLSGNEREIFGDFSDSVIYDTLANGDYYIDYEYGIVYYKNSGAGTAETIDYKYTSTNVTATIPSGTAFELKDDATDVRANVEDDGGKNALYVQSESLGIETQTDYGMATAGTANTLTDSTKHWGTDIFKDFIIRIWGGTGVGQTRKIANNTGTIITVSSAWDTQPSTDSQYVVIGSTSNASTASSGAAGDSDTTYKSGVDFTATVTDSTKNIVLSVDNLGGDAITEANIMPGSLIVYDTSESKAITINLIDNFTWTSATKTLSLSGNSDAFTFNTGDVVHLSLEGRPKTKDLAQSVVKTIEQAPENRQNFEQEDFISETNQADSTINRTAWEVSDYRCGSLLGTQTAGTADDTVVTTFWGSNKNNPSTSSDSEWIDITEELLGAGVTSITTTNGSNDIKIIVDTHFAMKNMMIKRTYSYGGGGSASNAFSVDSYQST